LGQPLGRRLEQRGSGGPDPQAAGRFGPIESRRGFESGTGLASSPRPKVQAHAPDIEPRPRVFGIQCRGGRERFLCLSESSQAPQGNALLVVPFGRVWTQPQRAFGLF
jgi:hypothetical protein